MTHVRDSSQTENKSIRYKVSNTPTCPTVITLNTRAYPLIPSKLQAAVMAVSVFRRAVDNSVLFHLSSSAAMKTSTSMDGSDNKKTRHKLKKFLIRRPTLQAVRDKGYIKGSAQIFSRLRNRSGDTDCTFSTTGILRVHVLSFYFLFLLLGRKVESFPTRFWPL